MVILGSSPPRLAFSILTESIFPFTTCIVLLNSQVSKHRYCTIVHCTDTHSAQAESYDKPVEITWPALQGAAAEWLSCCPSNAIQSLTFYSGVRTWLTVTQHRGIKAK